jgi:hypothetical protein
MLITTQDIYNAVVYGINKEQTGTVTPGEFEFLINEAQLEIIRDRYNEEELNQKRIDDLRILKTQDEILNTGPTVTGQEIFLLPYNAISFVVTPGNPSGTNHGYCFLLNVGFKIQYKNNECGLTGESKTFLKSRVLKTDVRYEINRDPYKKPKDTRLYHEVIGNRIKLYTGTDSYGLICQISYLRYPKRITLLDPNSCEMPLHLRNEIVDVAVRKKLQRIESGAFQTKIIDNNLSSR